VRSQKDVRIDVEKLPKALRFDDAQTAFGVQAIQRDASQLHHVTVDGLADWIAWWDAEEAGPLTHRRG
jgi:hypothetical protein